MKKLILTVILMTAFSLACLADGGHGTTGGTKPGPSRPSMSETKQGGTNGRYSEKGGTNGKMGGAGNKSETNANGGGGLKNGATGT